MENIARELMAKAFIYDMISDLQTKKEETSKGLKRILSC